MNRRDVIKGALLSAGAISSGSAMAQEVESRAGEGRQTPAPHESFPAAPRKTNGERMPNILWVCTDQQRFDTISGLSNSVIRTPNLEKFMAESVTFTNAFCQTPICSPSRNTRTLVIAIVQQLPLDGLNRRETTSASGGHSAL